MKIQDILPLLKLTDLLSPAWRLRHSGSAAAFCSLMNWFSTKLELYITCLLSLSPEQNSYLYENPSFALTVHAHHQPYIFFFLVHLQPQDQPMGLTMFGWVPLNMWNWRNWMGHQADQRLDQGGVKNPKGSLGFRPGVEEETSHSCSWHLHEWLDVFSVW